MVAPEIARPRFLPATLVSLSSFLNKIRARFARILYLRTRHSFSFSSSFSLYTCGQNPGPAWTCNHNNNFQRRLCRFFSMLSFSISRLVSLFLERERERERDVRTVSRGLSELIDFCRVFFTVPCNALLSISFSLGLRVGSHERVDNEDTSFLRFLWSVWRPEWGSRSTILYYDT